MRKNRLFRKFYLLNILTVVVTVVMLLVFLAVTVMNYLVSEKRTLLTNYCSTVAASMTSSPSLTSSDTARENRELWRNLLVLGRVIDADVFISDTDGSVQVCSCQEWAATGSCIHSGRRLPSRVIKGASAGQYYEVGNLGGIYPANCHTVGVPITDSRGNVIYIVFASTPASVLEAWIKNFSLMAVACAAIPLMLACIVAYISTKRMLHPIMQMREAAHCLAEGDFSKRIVCDGRDEIAELAESFNQMTNSLVQLEGMRRSFVANVSHELRTPMTTISGFIDGILDGTIEPEKQEHYLRIVSDESKRLSGIVSSMLSLARLESGRQQINLTEVDLHALACSVLISQEQRIETGKISVSGLENGENTQIYVDKDLFYQVIYNLVDNAIKFTPEGGEISIGVFGDGANAHFTVRNSGNGIPEKELPYVFERFYKTDRARSENRQSSGLGLYIVKSVIDIHRGTVTVRSVYGEYTEFEVVVPKDMRGNI